jgi:hypothetical protein
VRRRAAIREKHQRQDGVAADKRWDILARAPGGGGQPATAFIFSQLLSPEREYAKRARNAVRGKPGPPDGGA